MVEWRLNMNIVEILNKKITLSFETFPQKKGLDDL